MCVRMCVCIYIYIYTLTCMYIYIYTSVCPSRSVCRELILSLQGISVNETVVRFKKEISDKLLFPLLAYMHDFGSESLPFLILSTARKVFRE
jgi:hypothetical protein